MVHQVTASKKNFETCSVLDNRGFCMGVRSATMHCVERVQLRPPVVRRPHVLSDSAAEPPFEATTFKVGSPVRSIQGFIGNQRRKEAGNRVNETSNPVE